MLDPAGSALYSGGSLGILVFAVVTIGGGLIGIWRILTKGYTPLAYIPLFCFLIYPIWVYATIERSIPPWLAFPIAVMWLPWLGAGKVLYEMTTDIPTNRSERKGWRGYFGDEWRDFLGACLVFLLLGIGTAVMGVKTCGNAWEAC